MKNDKNKFKLEFNQLFVGKGIGHNILYEEFIRRF